MDSTCIFPSAPWVCARASVDARIGALACARACTLTNFILVTSPSMNESSGAATCPRASVRRRAALTLPRWSALLLRPDAMGLCVARR